MAFALVIIENVTFIAEPYIFGIAIDDLREANRIENEVDSSVTNSIIQQSIDSVRDFLLDSLSQYLPEEPDSSQSFLSRPNPSSLRSQVPVIIPAVFVSGTEFSPSSRTEVRAAYLVHQQQTPLAVHHKKRPRRDSLKLKLDKSIEQIKRSDTDAAARADLQLNPPPGRHKNKLRRILNRNDTIN